MSFHHHYCQCDGCHAPTKQPPMAYPPKPRPRSPARFPVLSAHCSPRPTPSLALWPGIAAGATACAKSLPSGKSSPEPQVCADPVPRKRSRTLLHMELRKCRVCGLPRDKHRDYQHSSHTCNGCVAVAAYVPKSAQRMCIACRTMRDPMTAFSHSPHTCDTCHVRGPVSAPASDLPPARSLPSSPHASPRRSTQAPTTASLASTPASVDVPPAKAVCGQLRAVRRRAKGGKSSIWDAVYEGVLAVAKYPLQDLCKEEVCVCVCVCLCVCLEMAWLHTDGWQPFCTVS